MTIDQDVIERAVRKVLASMDAEPVAGDGVLDDVDDAVAAAAQAAAEYRSRLMSDRRRYVAAIRSAMLAPDALDHLAAQAVIETGMGDVTHKYLKNKFAAEATPGVEDLITEAWSGDEGLTTVEYSGYGVIGAITPTTNPSETITCNSIGMLAAGNAVVFSPHPRAKRLSAWQVRRINQALRQAGAPENLVCTIREPSLEATTRLIAHPGVSMLVATGGPAIVRTVMASGKKAIGAGAGNPPVVVDVSADIEYAAKCIVDGASFDNNLPCTSEKECVAVDGVADLLKFCMLKHGAVEVANSQLRALEQLIIADGRPVTDWIGQPASKMLAAIGVEPPPGARLIVCEADAGHPFVQRELMMPVLPIVRTPDTDAAIDLACELEHGNRHTAVMHSKDVSRLTQMGKQVQTTIFVKNGPSFAGIGIGGEGFCTFTIAGPTGEGLTSARHFARRRRCVLVGDLSVR